MKKYGFNPIDIIIHKRTFIEKMFIILFIISILCVPLVGVNYDLTKYLPESAPSSKALDIMEKEFTYPGMGRVLLEDVSIYEAKAIKDKIEKVDGVDMVLWCDTKENIYGSGAFIDYSSITDYYKDGDAYMDITFLESDSSQRTHKAVKQIEKIIGDDGVLAGSAASDTMLGPTINGEVAKVMGIAVLIILLILLFTTNSWFEPFMFLSIMGIAITIGMGTNILFGEISFMSNAVGAVLQLACSMDYSIFLLHSFTREKEKGIEPEQAMANALRHAITSIGASGATTIVGFLALALMSFGIGPDMGFVLAKSIICSLATVILLMPAFILRFREIIEKTEHKPFVPSFRKMGEIAYKIRTPLTIIVLIVVIPCYVGQSMADFSYGNEAITNSKGTAIHEYEIKMNEKFGQSNMMIALIPKGDNISEKELTQELDKLPYTRKVMSLADVLPSGIPEEFLPQSITGQLHGKNWARILINVRSAGESEQAFKYCDEIRDIVSKYYDGDETYILGVTPATQDIKKIITSDYNFVNIISLLGVALVVMLTYKSAVLPIVVLIPIEAAVFINTALPYIYGQRTMFLGFIIVSCVQLGATIDYSILMTGNYLDARIKLDKKEAAIKTVEQSALSVMTSGFILASAGYGLYFLTSIEAVGSLGRLIGRGALLSMFLVLFMLPACLMAFDRFIVKADYEKNKNEKIQKILNKKISIQKLTDLQKQHILLREQLKKNRAERRKVFLEKIKKLKSKKESKKDDDKK